MRALAALLSRLARRRERAAGTQPDGVATHDVATPPGEIEAYWTEERIRQATPREQRLDPPER